MFLGDLFDGNIFNSSRSSQVIEGLSWMRTASAHMPSKTDANSVLPKISGKI